MEQFKVGDLVSVNMKGTYYYNDFIKGDYWVIGVVSQLAEDNDFEDTDIWVEFAQPNEHTPYESVFHINDVKPFKKEIY